MCVKTSLFGNDMFLVEMVCCGLGKLLIEDDVVFEENMCFCLATTGFYLKIIWFYSH